LVVIFVLHMFSFTCYDEEISHHDISDAIQSLGGPMKRAPARRVNDALIQLKTKSMEDINKVQENESKFVLSII